MSQTTSASPSCATPTVPDSPPASVGLWVWRGATFALALTILVGTEPRLAMVWDEGYTLGRVERVRLWFQAVADPSGFAARWTAPTREYVQPDQPYRPPPRADQIDTRAELFSQPALEWFWPFAREEPHGHPPGYALFALIGDGLTPWREPLARARLGTMLLAAWTAGALAVALRKRFGPEAALVGASCWLLHPRLFAEAHYATYDALLASLTVLCGLALLNAVAARRSGRKAGFLGWSIVLGLGLGWAATLKLTGWFLVLPLAAWVGLSRCRAGFVALALALPIGLGLAFALNPAFWPDPLEGFRRFWVSNTTRDQTINIETLYLGTVYATPRDSLPWHNTLVLTVATTPALMVFLGLRGGLRTLAKLPGWALSGPAQRDPGRDAVGFGLMFGLLACFFLTLRALPHTPGHDGVRQFLPAFGGLAALAGLGIGPRAASSRAATRRLARLLTGLTLAELGLSLAVMMPTPLSYYSPLVGGLPGATKLGFEPTYYWDALDEEALTFLNENTPPPYTVAFASFPTSWLYLHDMGHLKPEPWTPLVGPDRPPRWKVIQNRPGSMSAADRRLVSQHQAAYVHSKLGVPLLWIVPLTPPTVDSSLLRPDLREMDPR